MENLKNQIFDKISQKHEELIALSDNLADNPEISGQEYETVQKIGKLLQNQGFDFQSPFANLPTGFFACKSKEKKTHKIAILVEYDALPKLGHACGHNVSCAISLLAGIALADLENKLDMNIHIIGTPVEETDGAKCKMAQDGIFDGYDMAMMIHLYNCNAIEPQIVCLSSFLYEFTGKSAHSSDAPWEGINALNGAQLFMHAVDMLRQHVTPDVQMHGIYKDGGAAPNIVPDSSSIELYLRAKTKETLEKVIEKVENCAQGAAIATQTKINIKPTSNMYLDLRSSQTGTKALAQTYQDLGLDYEVGGMSFGSSDIGNISYKCPTFHPTLAIVEKGQPLHTKEFEKATKTKTAHDAIKTGAKIIALHTINLVQNKEQLTKIKQELGF